MSSQIAGAQADVQSQIVQLRSNGPINGDALAQMVAQVARLSALQKQIGTADPKDLPAIQSQIAAAVAVAQSVAQQSQSGVTASKSAQASLSEAVETAHKVDTEFRRDFYERREFDKYLHFTSTQDEEEYRRREQERKAAIERANAEHTPEGELRANRLEIEQLKDAGAHGADKAPNYKPTLDGLESGGHQLAQSIGDAHSGRSRASQSSQTATKLPPDVLASLSAVKAVRGDDANKGHGLAVNTQPSSSRSI